MGRKIQHECDNPKCRTCKVRTAVRKYRASIKEQDARLAILKRQLAMQVIYKHPSNDDKIFG